MSTLHHYHRNECYKVFRVGSKENCVDAEIEAPMLEKVHVGRKRTEFKDFCTYSTPLKSCSCGGEFKIDHQISAVLYDLVGIFDVFHVT